MPLQRFSSTFTSFREVQTFTTRSSTAYLLWYYLQCELLIESRIDAFVTIDASTSADTSTKA